MYERVQGHSLRVVNIVQEVPPKLGQSKPRQRRLCRLAVHRGELLIMKFGAYENAYVVQVKDEKALVITGVDGDKIALPLDPATLAVAELAANNESQIGMFDLERKVLDAY